MIMDNTTSTKSTMAHLRASINDLIAVRYVMAVLAFLGTTNVYTMRVNLNIAMVAMANAHKNSPNDTSGRGQCSSQLYSNSSSNSSLSEHVAEFDWDEQTQGVILSSFFWGYIITQLPGGRLAEILSAKWLFGLGILTTATFTLLTPLAARLGVWYLIGTRIIEGIFEGVTIPAVYSLFAKWCPPLERTQMFSLIHLGVAVGSIIASPISAALLDVPVDGGWPFVFYFFGGVGVLWFVFWTVLVYETPSVHPRISEREKSYILDSLQVENRKGSRPESVPWKSILTSMPFWAIFVGQFGYLWGIYTVLTELPTYLKTVIRFDVKQSASLTALPYVGKLLSTMFFAYFGDFCRRRKYMSTGTTRKVLTTIGNVLPAAFFIAIPQAGCHKVAVVVMFILATTFHGAGNAGVIINHADIAPRYAGTLFGITNTAGTAAGILAPYFVGYITNGNSTLETWGIVFYICAAIHVATNIFYIVFSSGEEQSWNNNNDDKDDNKDSNETSKENPRFSYDNKAFDAENEKKQTC